MKITLLGTGTSQGVPVIGCSCDTCLSSDPRDDRQRASILLSDGDVNVVVDTGPDFRRQMLGQKVNSLDAVILTHQHNDHVAGMDDLRPFIFRQRREMPIYATIGVIKDIEERFSYAFSAEPYPGAPRLITYSIESGKRFIIGGIELLPIEVMHGKLPVMAFRIGDFTYVTDANYISKESLDLMKGTKTLIINALHQHKHYSHFNLEEALEIVDIIAPEKCYLTHISHTMGLTKEWEATLPDNVFPSADGMTFDS